MKAKGDRSKKVGGRRNKGPAAKASSVRTTRQWINKTTFPGGAEGYHKRQCTDD